MSGARLWHNGRVFTGRRFAEAILIDDGRVVSVGTTAQVRRSAPTGTESEDLGGHLIIPGLIDAHLHLARVTLTRESLDIGPARSLGELIARSRDWAVRHPVGTVVGHGWRADQFDHDAVPSRTELDEAVPDRPFVIYHSSGHAVVVNSPALARIGIDRATPDPRGGRIGRDPEGQPSGVLYESAIRSVEPVVSEVSQVDPEALLRTLESLAAFGLTTVASMNVGAGEAGALRRLRDDQRLPIRVRLYTHLEAIRDHTRADFDAYSDPEYLAVTGIKGFTDGAFGPRTAWLSAPYADAPDQVGLPAENDAELADALQSAAALGLAPALHAIGDRAVQRALKLLRTSVGATAAPPRIEHAALTPPELFPHLEDVGPALVVQPGFVWSDHWLAERLGRERARWAYAFRSLTDRGLLLAGSSDAPYDPVDPWRGLQACVARRDPEGRSANPETAEAVPVEEALQMYTVNGGRVLGEPELGLLEAGGRADLSILDTADLGEAFRRGAAGIRETRVGGEVVAAGKPAIAANG